ncbi:MAG: hypothetical protein HHJ09_09480 [Glaciimonas sp.]|nr:hypothetical protein [Glaciimonas sp.]
MNAQSTTHKRSTKQTQEHYLQAAHRMECRHNRGALELAHDRNTRTLGQTLHGKFCCAKKYIAKLCFWEEANLVIDANHWHFDPREFIRQFRKCGWLAEEDIVKVIRKTFPKKNGQELSSLTHADIHES